MIPKSFSAFYVDENHENSIKTLPTAILPDHEVTIRVQYSSLNYKDSLSARGLNNVTRSYPHIPGIDAAGHVIDDVSGTFKNADRVVVTGHDLGTNTLGGFGQIIRVPKDWVVPIPDSLTALQTMAMGTAGFTALYGIHRLQREQIYPESGPVLVTGATGGVGSFATFALSKMGYEVVAATRKTDATDFLISLGAKSVIHSEDISLEDKRPLLPRKWAGCIETVGGELLDSVLTQMYPKGAVACCGNVLGISLQTNILPFILRGISLLGIDSAFCEQKIREEIWKEAAKLGISDLPNDYYRIVSLDNLNPEIDSILAGRQKGRVVVAHS